MLSPKIYDRAFTMVQAIANKHEGDMRSLDFDWYILEWYDSRNEIIQSPMPWLRIDFK